MTAATDRVLRTRDEARASYDRLAPVWDLALAPFERRHREECLALLAAAPGERVVEVGYATGACTLALAKAVAPDGRVSGIDLSPRMHERASRRLARAGIEADLRVGDALALPWPEASFDAAFSSFTLELLDTPELPRALAELRRVVRPGGRIALVTLARAEAPNVVTRLYGWAHRRFPALVDCRPIPLRELVLESGLQVTEHRRGSLFGLPVEHVLARR